MALTVDGPVKSIDGVDLLELAENDALVAVANPVDLTDLNARFEAAGVAVCDRCRRSAGSPRA